MTAAVVIRTEPEPAPPVRLGRVLLAFLARDLHVVFRRQLVGFLARVIVEPLLMVFVFSYVLPTVSGAPRTAGAPLTQVLMPGVLATTMLFSGVMGVTMPLISELSYPKTVQDRLLTPAPPWAVGAARIASGTVQSVVAVLLVLPIAFFLHAPGHSPGVTLHHWPLLVVVVLTGSLLAAALGLWLGSVIPPAQVNLMFSLVMMPAMMLGCVYYPWTSLEAIPWLRAAVLANPVVYLSEGMRAALTPAMPHLSLWALLPVVIGGGAVMTLLGLRAFRRAALD
ncbi:ABC transporter permease [Streptomyces sp. NPDC001709]